MKVMDTFMLSLSKPDRDPVADFDTALGTDHTSWREEALRSARDEITAHYDIYDRALVDGNVIPPLTLPESVSAALRSTYDSIIGRKDLQEIREDLLSIAYVELDGFCPLCGIDQVSQLDHWAPKESFPEFSILAGNLIPVCPRCNTLKGTKRGDSLDLMPYSHAYYHNRNLQPLLEVAILQNTDDIYVSFRAAASCPRGTSQQALDRFRYQMRTLQLPQRLARVGSAELVANSAACQGIYRGQGEEGVRTNSLEIAERLKETWGPNHWRSVLHFALAASEEYCSGGFRKALKVPR